MRFALIGQPNCGKSTLFNQVAGYRAETGNFSGTTTTFTESKVRVLGQIVDLVDLPGTYTLAGTNPAERVVFQYLESQPVDVIINILDASHLAQGLNLTLELMELGIPIVAAANMMDEIARMGIGLDGQTLEDLLGIRMLPLVASKSRGVRKLFVTAMEEAQQKSVPPRQPFSADLEVAIQKLVVTLNGQSTLLGSDGFAIKLLEGETSLIDRMKSQIPGIQNTLDEAQQNIQTSYGQNAIWVINAER
ncbi:MAG: FeoB small GTPase domain-containing protein, partial [Anaerolineales bacterium]